MVDTARDTLLRRTPFAVKALQVDGGWHFEATSEQACQERGIALFVLPPHFPKLNSHVEGVHHTHSEEFFELGPGDGFSQPRPSPVGDIHNCLRSHEALDSRTPAEYLTQCHPAPAPGSTVSYVLNEHTD